MKVSAEYAVLVINTQEQQGQAADALAESLFNKLKKITTAKRPSLSISIEPVISDSEQVTSWSVSIESSRSIKRCLIKEFFLPPTAGPNTRAYLLWNFRAVKRAVVYLSHKLPEIWRQATSTSQKTLGILLGILRITAETLGVVLETIFFVYLIPLMAFTVIRPLRRMGTLVFLLYLFAIVSVVVSLTWEQTLIPLIAWISQLTHQVIVLVADSDLTFDILFPVVASTVFGVALTVVFILGRIVRWIIGKWDIIQVRNPRTIGELSYLLDPLYAAKLRDNFERQLIDLNKAPNIQRIFVVCDHTGALLAYEVLSRACRGKISKPVYLQTRNLSLAGLSASPVRSLWLLVDSIDWGRFSEATPSNLSWYHVTGWPSREFTVKLTSRSGRGITPVELHFEKSHWYQGRNAMIIDRLITLIKLA